MKKIIILSALILLCFSVKSQPSAPKFDIASALFMSNCARYTVDYEIKGWNGVIKDSLSINKLNLNEYDAKRKEKEDAEIFDAGTGLTVIVYSEKKTAIYKSKY